MKSIETSQKDSNEARFKGTHPSATISNSKVDSVLNFLTFSGTPIYLWVESSPEIMTKLQAPTQISDTSESEFLVELPQTNLKLSPGAKVEVSFGYKRKRAKFKTEVSVLSGNTLHLKNPESIFLTNLRKNPRAYVESGESLRTSYYC